MDDSWITDRILVNLQSIDNSRVDRMDLAWAAGFFDGNGSFGYSYQKSSKYIYFYPYINVFNPNRQTLEIVQNIFGVHSTITPKTKNDPIWRYQCERRYASWVALSVLPFMRSEYQRARAGMVAAYAEGDHLVNRRLYEISHQLSGSAIPGEIDARDTYIKPEPKARKCSVLGCSNAHIAKGFCMNHYQAARRHDYQRP